MEHTRVSLHQRLLTYAFSPPSALERDFDLTADGLTDRQVRQMRRSYGANHLGPSGHPTPLQRLRRAFATPFSGILAVLALVSFFTDVYLPADYGRSISTVLLILIMLLLSGLLRLWQDLRAGRASDALAGIIQATVTVRRDGQLRHLPPEELVVGDRVVLTAGDRVPADLRITDASDLFLSQSLLTGESAILEKNALPLPPDTPATLNQLSNLAFMGTSVLSGQGEGVVLAVGKDTVYGNYHQELQQTRDRFDQGSRSIAWVLIRFMVVLVPVVFAVCALTKGAWMTSLLFAVSVAVGLTPEMLPMVINACLARGSAAMEQKQTLVKTISAMQGFGGMDVLCVDKTGTLTGDQVVLEYYLDILGNESRQVLDAAYLNSLFHTGVVNPLDRALLACATMPDQSAHLHTLAQTVHKLDELPFDHTRKCVSVLVQDADGRRFLLTKGDVEQVYSRCRFVEHQGKRVEIDPTDASGVHLVVDEMQEDGMKVLAVACKPLPDDSCLTPESEAELTLLGYVVFFDAPKPSAAGALARLQQLNVGVKVLTGDQKSVALSVCRRLGLDVAVALTGTELEQLPPEQWPAAAEQCTLFAELTPTQKSRIVRLLQDNGHTVGFLGDGMNDLSAMSAADIGISVDTAAEALREAADVVLLKKDLNVLEQGILEGRKAFANMTKYIRITASSNLGNILSIAAASALLPFLPMTAAQLLLLNVLYDTLCMTLPWDAVDPDTCQRPLTWSGEHLSRFMRFFAPLSSLFDLVTFAFLYFVLCPGLLGGYYPELSGADQLHFTLLFHTGWFLESLWSQVLIVHMLRTRHIPFFQSSPARAVWLVTLLGLAVLTALVYTPLAPLLGLAPLPPVYFLFLAGVVAGYLLLTTLAKRWYVRTYGELL